MSKYKGKENIKSEKIILRPTIITCEICKTPGGTLLKVKKFNDKEDVYIHMECVKELVRQDFDLRIETK